MVATTLRYPNRRATSWLIGFVRFTILRSKLAPVRQDFRHLRFHRDVADSNEPRAAILVGCSDTDATRLNCVSATLPRA